MIFITVFIVVLWYLYGMVMMNTSYIFKMALRVFFVEESNNDSRVLVVISMVIIMSDRVYQQEEG